MMTLPLTLTLTLTLNPTPTSNHDPNQARAREHDAVARPLRRGRQEHDAEQHRLLKNWRSSVQLARASAELARARPDTTLTPKLGGARVFMVHVACRMHRTDSWAGALI